MDTFIGDWDGQLMVCCNMWHIHNDIHLYCNCCSASSRCNGYIQKNVCIDDFDFVKSLDIYRKWFKASTQKYEPNKSLLYIDTKIQPKAECPKAESNCIKKESDLILSWHIYQFIIFWSCSNEPHNVKILCHPFHQIKSIVKIVNWSRLDALF